MLVRKGTVWTLKEAILIKLPGLNSGYLAILPMTCVMQEDQSSGFHISVASCTRVAE